MIGQKKKQRFSGTNQKPEQGLLFSFLTFLRPNFFLARLDFSLPPLTAPGSPRMAKPRTGEKELDAKNLIQRFYEIDLDGVCMFQSKSVTVFGTKYVCGDNNYLFLGLDEHGLPGFGKVTYIWYVLQTTNPFFVTKVMQSEEFCNRLGAYKLGNQVTTFRSIPASSISRQ